MPGACHHITCPGQKGAPLLSFLKGPVSILAGGDDFRYLVVGYWPRSGRGVSVPHRTLVFRLRSSIQMTASLLPASHLFYSNPSAPRKLEAGKSGLYLAGTVGEQRVSPALSRPAGCYRIRYSLCG